MVPTFDLNQVSDPEHRAIIAMLTHSKLSPTELSKRIHVSRSKLYRIAEKYLGSEFMSERDQTIKFENLKSAALAGVHVSEAVIKIDSLPSEKPEPNVGAGTSKTQECKENYDDSNACEEPSQHPVAVDVIPNHKVNITTRAARKEKQIENLIETMQSLFKRGKYPKIKACHEELTNMSEAKICKLRRIIYIMANSNKLPECTSQFFPGICFNEFICRYERIMRRCSQCPGITTEDTNEYDERISAVSLPYIEAPQEKSVQRTEMMSEATIKVRGVELTVRCAPGDMGDCVVKILDKLKEF